MRHLAFPVVALLMVCAAARGTPPADPSRLLQTFSFEERELGNDEDVPMHWDKLDGIDYPHYVTGHLSSDRSRSGRYSFRMDLNGGSCGYRYEARRLPVVGGAHYRLGGWCQTTPLTYARARLTVALADMAGQTIPGTTRHSDPYAGGDDAWHELSVEVTADAPGAAYLVVQMELVQPNVYATSDLGDRSVFLQDIRGSAWFDDVIVSQVPRVAMTTDRPANLFRRDERPHVSVLVNDPCTDDLTAQLVVADNAGRPVYQRTGGVDLSAAETVAPSVRRLTLEMPSLPAGWYQASLVMMSRGEYVGRQTLGWVQLADDGASPPPDGRFGVSAIRLPFDALPVLPKVLPLLSAGRVKLPVWTAEGRVEQASPEAFDDLLEQLQDGRVAAEGCLLAAPSGRWPQASPAAWQAPLADLVSRHVGHLPRWQLGGDDTDAFAVDPAMRRVYGEVRRQFAQLVDNPDLAVPCPVSRELPAGAPASLALSVPTTVTPDEIPFYVRDFNVAGNGRTSLTLVPLDRDRYGHEQQVADYAKRLVYALAAGATRVDVPLPVESRRQGEVTTQEPTELLPVLRTLWTSLAGSTYVGELPLAADVHAFLFDRDGVGTVVLWTDDSGDSGGGGGGERGDGVRPVSVNLGTRPVRVDLYGNATPLVQPLAVGGSTAGLMRMQVGRVPVLLTDVDGRLARLRASVSVDQPLLESSYQPHVRHLRLTNPYPQPVAGTLRLRGPAGWTLSPPVLSFTLNPGETVDREVGVGLPYNTLAGPNVLAVDVDLQADRPTRFTVPLTLTVGLTDVAMRATAWRDGPDLVVQQRVTNYGDRPVTYDATAAFPGQPRLERLVADLAPGRTTIKKYRFAHVTPAAGPCKVRLGLREADGPRVLNAEVGVE